MRSCRPGRLSLVPSAQRCGVTVTSCCSVHLRPSYVGVVLALGAAGGVAAGMAARPLTARIGSARIAWVSMTVFSLPGLLIPLAGPGWRVLLFAAGWISWTFSATLCGIVLVSYQQASCPPGLRGRVSAAQRWINWGTLPLGALAGGALGSAIGVHATLWLAVAGGCSSGLWLYLSPLRGLRDLPGTLRPAPAPVTMKNPNTADTADRTAASSPGLRSCPFQPSTASRGPQG